MGHFKVQQMVLFNIYSWSLEHYEEEKNSSEYNVGTTLLEWLSEKLGKSSTQKAIIKLDKPVKKKKN